MEIKGEQKLFGYCSKKNFFHVPHKIEILTGLKQFKAGQMATDRDVTIYSTQCNIIHYIDFTIRFSHNLF